MPSGSVVSQDRLWQILRAKHSQERVAFVFTMPTSTLLFAVILLY